VLTELGIPKLWGEDPERAWLVGRAIMTKVLGVICPTVGYGCERVPPSGGGVVAANHFGTVDPPLVGIFSPRTIYYMGKEELLAVPIAGEVLRWLGTFGVRRGEGDRDSIRVARWVVREGHLLGMFMEGTRQQFGYPGPVHPGPAMIAIQEEVPVIPVGVDTFRWSLKNRRRCALVWGQPISLAALPRTGKGYKEGAAVLEGEITRLWRMAAEAGAAGWPKRLPDGTARSGPYGPLYSTRIEGAKNWPDEPWAREPLGPVYRGPAAEGPIRS
jgi:1-acyl-sn-glycerol-3-phosphate acyltransferase